MKVRIKETPHEPEVDGIKLSHLAPGSVLDLSASIATWLVVQGYADLEMRNSRRFEYNNEKNPAGASNDRRNRR